MKLNEKPEVKTLADNDKIWSSAFDSFSAKVYVPSNTLEGAVINYGYSAPYLIVLTDSLPDDNEAVSYAEKTGLKNIAASFDSSVVYICPAGGKAWSDCNEELYKELISNSKIHQYHKDGYAILNNRFTKTVDGYAIRGAIFRVFLFAKDCAADYVAANLLKPITGDGLWGPADICPTVCILENLSVTPKIERKNMPILSVNNTDEINECIKAGTDYFEKFDYSGNYPEFSQIFKSFIYTFKRWGWVGDISFEPDLASIGMNEEPVVTTLKTSADNAGDDAKTTTHKVGFIAFYNKDLFDKGPAPLLLCFHGGGDSAKHIAYVSEWYKVAHDHDFLLVCVEDHINSTATEMMELLGILKEKYNIDSSRIYGSGFSMGGCKSWDLYQEYPEVFAGLAPMDATFELGLNVFGQPSPVEINKDVLVPIYYIGGEETPLPELPFQAEKCTDRIRYVFDVNKVNIPYTASFAEKECWKNKIWGVNGDKTIVIHDNDRDSDLTLNCFKSNDGNYYTLLGSVSKMGHECRYHSCEYAWRFLSRFRRLDNKELIGGENDILL